MKCAKGIWLRCGLLPYRLRGQRSPWPSCSGISRSTAAQLAAALTEKATLRLTDAGKIAGPPVKAWYPLRLLTASTAARPLSWTLPPTRKTSCSTSSA